MIGMSVICLPLTIFLLTVSAAEAQQLGKIPTIGFIRGGSPDLEVGAFRQGLRELGYIEGKNIFVDIKIQQGRPIVFSLLRRSWPA
jgi:putative ABC transport system substrate-binding protein